MKALSDMTEPEMKDYFNMLASLIESVLPAGPGPRGRSGFALIVFDDPGIGQYVSNCARPGVIQAMRACADRIEKNMDIRRDG